MELKRQLGLMTGILIVVADMIGTGIFMTTGNILGMTGSAPVVLALWALGGLVAISGTLCYAELAAMWPDVGGEYVYLKRIFGPLPAFLTGWVSLIVGFSAPVATSSLLLVQYLNRFMHIAIDPSGGATGALDGVWAQKSIAAGIVVFFGAIHIIGVKRGGYFQNFLTVLKLLIISSIIVFGLFALDWSAGHRLSASYPAAESAGAPVIGLALLIIMFAYSGWNGASYIAGEMRDPEKTMPRALLLGTIITTGLYLLINVVFLMSADGPELMGKDEVGAVATQAIFGPGVSGLFTIGIAVILLSAISVQTMVGPRVYFAMAKDGLIFNSLSRVHPRFETPHLSILIQMILSVFYVFSGSAMTLVIYMGFALNVFPVLTVIGLMYMRRRAPELARPYKTPLYPVVPLVYVLLTTAMMIAALMNWTMTSLVAIGVLALGIPVFYVWKRFLGDKTIDAAG